jgi:hypothetical protein
MGHIGDFCSFTTLDVQMTRVIHGIGKPVAKMEQFRTLSEHLIVFLQLGAQQEFSLFSDCHKA